MKVETYLVKCECTRVYLFACTCVRHVRYANEYVVCADRYRGVEVGLLILRWFGNRNVRLDRLACLNIEFR